MRKKQSKPRAKPSVTPRLQVVGHVSLERFLAVKEKSEAKGHKLEIVAVAPKRR